VVQRAGTTRRQTEGAPAARPARWALRGRCAVITVTALGMALTAAADTDRATYPEFRRVAKELTTRIGFLPL
jgi:hypothetical protein